MYYVFIKNIFTFQIGSTSGQPKLAHLQGATSVVKVIITRNQTFFDSGRTYEISRQIIVV
jgi:hypothetical protein